MTRLFYEKSVDLMALGIACCCEHQDGHDAEKANITFEADGK
jgi:hypothetical protein